MRASTLKALIIHTADDKGTAGPDYQYGWGLMNTRAAADLIKQHADNSGNAAMIESSVSTGVPSRTHTIGGNGATPLRVTLCWTDPAGTSMSGSDNRTRVLVNDLNLTVTGPDGAVYYPYVMPYVGDWTAATIGAAAVTGVNAVDNVEQVYLSSPTSGCYTITVDYAGTLSGGSQNYSLIITGQSGPEIEVEEAGSPTVSLVDNAGVRDFGAVGPSDAPVVRTFAIRNTGGSPLAGLLLTQDGANPGDFVFSSLATNTLASAASTTFSVAFDPTGTGTRSAALHIANNDADENPFDINLTGTGLSALESWRRLHFGSTANSGPGADTNDFEGDLAINLLEFATATNPKLSDRMPASVAVNGANFEYTYQRNKTALGEMTFETVWTDDLLSGLWTHGGVTEAIISDDGSVQIVKALVPLGSADNRFVRLRITRN